MQDLITTALTDNGGFRIYAAVTTNLVREASQIHGCSPLAYRGGDYGRNAKGG